MASHRTPLDAEAHQLREISWRSLGRDLDSGQRMLPRQVLPRQFYLITRRCSQRLFLLRPDPATNNAFLYCLIAAALRCEIAVLLPCAMSNHHLCAAAHNQ
jgi:hypothetical protein